MLFICLFGLKKKLLTKQKLHLYSGFLTGQYDFTQYVLFMIFIKFENRDKTSSKTEQAQKRNKTKQNKFSEWVICQIKLLISYHPGNQVIICYVGDLCHV